MDYLRFPPPKVSTGPRTPRRPAPQPSILTLGKATVALYVILLLAAVISARVLPMEDAPPVSNHSALAASDPNSDDS